MRIYGVKGKDLQSFDIHSLEELKELKRKFDWIWLDCVEPSPEELEIVSQFVNLEPSALEDFKSSKILPHHKRLNGYTLLSICHATMQEEKLKTYPIYILMNQKTILTLRKKESSAPVEYAIQALRDSLSEDPNTSPSFILCEISRENANKNLDVVMMLRDVIEELEEKTMAKPSKASINRVFALKKQIAVFYRILWNEQQVLNSLKNGLVPNIKLCKKSISSLEDSANSISKELEFLNSYDNALDGVLRLQDLSMIHKVERTLIYLTVITVIMNLILIMLELSGFRS